MRVTVLLGTGLEQLREHGSRWHHVAERWAADPRVDTLTLVDYPRFGPRPGVVDRTTWLPGVRGLRLTVGGRRAAGPLDDVAWRLAARQLHRAAPSDVVLAATPLWAPLLTHARADRRCFDAVDDWRVLGSQAAVRQRVEAGYRSTTALDAVTAVSQPLADRLRSDFGTSATVVRNGVDVAAYDDPGPPPQGVPDGPFAVYVGVVEQRVDVALLHAAARVLPVVVAGPTSDPSALQGLTWLGPLAVGQVPGLLAAAAVGLVPHRVDALTATMDPMKLLEYLAAGLPVVSTPVAGVEPGGRVLLADDAEAFAAAVGAAAALPPAVGPVTQLVGRDWDDVAGRLLQLHAAGAR